MDIYLKLIQPALVPVALTGLLYLLKKRTRLGRWKEGLQQLVYGILFGLAAVYGTEEGVDVGGAVANARDAAPLCAGLVFGAPAGIIAGVIGGVERYLAVYWGAGAYSQIACSLATILAGFYAAFLRKSMFDDKCPTFGIGLAAGGVMEVVHFTILFLTKLNDADQAFRIIKIVTLPMILVNSFSVGMAILLVAFFGRAGTAAKKGEKRFRRISDMVQVWLLILVVGAYLITTVFVYVLQTNTARTDAEKLLVMNAEDVRAEMKGLNLNGTRLLADNRHVASDGYVLVWDWEEKMVTTKEELLNTHISDHGIVMADHAPGTVFLTVSGGVECFAIWSEAEVYRFAILLPKQSVYDARDRMTYINSFMEVMVFAMLFLMIYFLVKRLVVDNIDSVNRSLDKIIGGNLQEAVNVRATEEFSSLSDDINQTVATLKMYINEAAARIDKELEYAKNIQYSALPSVFPAYPRISSFDIYATMDTAKEVGGDFYDFYMIGEDRLAFLVADVSGKGIPAALFMMQSKTMLKSLAENGLPVNEVFDRANEKLAETNTADMFVTGFMGILDLHTGLVQFTNAGHNPPLLRRKGGNYEYFRSRPNLVLAGMPGLHYRLQELQLQPGDRLFLYTDGVTEATDSDNQLYGEERLQEHLNTLSETDLQEVLHSTKRSVDRFAGEREQFDDITMLILEYKGEGTRSE